MARTTRVAYALMAPEIEKIRLNGTSRSMILRSEETCTLCEDTRRNISFRSQTGTLIFYVCDTYPTKNSTKRCGVVERHGCTKKGV